MHVRSTSRRATAFGTNGDDDKSDLGSVSLHIRLNTLVLFEAAPEKTSILFRKRQNAVF